MPTLADIYSMIDSAKRRGTDFIRNPGTSLQQMAGNANDRARAQLESDKAATDEFLATRNLNGPLQMQNAMEFAQGYNPVGMTVYHGSPHIFERFDLGKLGTGEGNQSYGRGMYVAENRGTGEQYKTALSKTNPIFNVGDETISYIDKPTTAAEKARNYVYENAKTALVEKSGKTTAKQILDDSWMDAHHAFSSNELNEVRNEIARLIESKGKKTLSPSEGYLYKVDLPDTHVRRMLDWDEPLKNQPVQVRKLAKSLGMDMNDLGGDLIGKIGKGEKGKQILQNSGIRGIKYLDEMSRDKQKGTRNFVVFDPNHLTILERNNQPIK